MRVDRFLAGIGAFAAAVAAHAQAPAPFAGGTFAPGQFSAMPAGQPPAGWKLQQSGGDAKIVEQAGQTFLRLVNAKQASTELVYKAAFPDEWEAVKITAKARVKGLKPGAEVWHIAKTQVLFFSADGKSKLTDGWPCVASFTADAADWQSSSVTLPNPAQAGAYLQIQVAMYNCAGTYDIESIQLEKATIMGFKREANGKPAFWGGEPVEAQSPTRGAVCLNGPWRFAPATGGGKDFKDDEWGLIWVPGSWRKEGVQGVIRRGKGDLWKGYDGNTLGMARYQRDFLVPKEWQGRAVLLDLARVSTDAEVAVNGHVCGKVEWPSGVLDITKAVKFGGMNDLRVQVSASAGGAVDWNLMGVEAGQVHKTEAKLNQRGIIGDVLLLSRPAGAHVSDVFVQTSTRKKEIKLDIELTGVAEAGSAKITADMLGADGKAAKSFTAELPVEAAATQTLAPAWTWDDPKLWDFQQPNLYTLMLKVEAPGLSDIYPQRFGFREFWIDGKRFMLNGTEFRLRPDLVPDQWGGDSSIPGIEATLKGMMADGFNFAELWPWDHDKRGEPHFRGLWADAADRLGLPMSGVALSVNSYIVDFASWACIWNEERKAKWTRRMADEMRRYRNHPSIVMWATSANFFGQPQDQYPAFIGMRDWYPKRAQAKAGLEAIDIIHKTDPTRPVFTHHGADIGDAHTCNNYLCLLPLQDREEWLSHWAEKGQMPYIAIEFGTPLFTTFQRGRDGYGNANASEPLFTEFAAAYLGDAAYKTETPAYRGIIVSKFKKEQEYASCHAQPEFFVLPSFQDIQSLFIRNTWRAWRTWGLSGGMVPWENGQRWRRKDNAETPLGLFKPGARGPFSPSIKNTTLHFHSPKAWTLLPSAHALVESNAESLAWIAGAPAFTDKTHNYAAGAAVAKQAVLINDARAAQPFSYTWKAEVGGKVVAEGKGAGDIAPAENKLMPIAFDLPAEIAAKSSGRILLDATIGARQWKDEFAFRVFPAN